MSSFLYFICIRHKWLIYVILWEYAICINILNLLILSDPVLNYPYNAHFLIHFTILLNPAIFSYLWFEEFETFSFIGYHLHHAGDVRIFVLFSVANLIFWMPVAFAIQMHAIKKYKKRKSIRMVAIGVTVIGLIYIWYILHPCLVEPHEYVPYFCRFLHT